MKDEIKEILECLEKYGQLTPDAIDDLHYIRDCITNLQEENKNLKEQINNRKLLDKQRFMMLISCYGMPTETKRNKCCDLQSKINKALEHIDKYCIDDEFYVNLTNKEKNIIVVKNILTGDK